MEISHILKYARKKIFNDIFVTKAQMGEEKKS
jgi:hypothetical protein